MNRETTIDMVKRHLEFCRKYDEGFTTFTADACADILFYLDPEPVKPSISESFMCNSGRMSRRRAWCGACGIGINMDAKFCDHCGRAVDWTDKDLKK